MNEFRLDVSRLPRLLYIGDVPVEPTVYGAALLFRLLQHYPADKLTIVEGSAWRSSPTGRLSGVQYKTLRLGPTRLIHSRLHRLYGSYLIRTAGLRQNQLKVVADYFQPEAILTIVQSYSWLTAARFAEKNQLPFHLILHDEWPRRGDMLPLVYQHAVSMFAEHYTRAASRLCISEAMAASYKQLFSAPATVLPPLQSVNGTSEPAERVLVTPKEFTVAYAGTISTKGYSRALAAVAEAAAKVGGKLKIFGLVDFARTEIQQLMPRNVEFCGFVSAPDLVERLRREADLLFLPMSFDEADRENMMLSFPSKLADYTAVGVPILIYGPSYCSVVRWAEQRPNVAEIVLQQNGSELARAINRLIVDPARRWELAQGALKVGREQFSSDRVLQTFYQTLTTI